MTVAFDNTFLSILLNPSGNIPIDPESGAPIASCKERAVAAVEKLDRAGQKVILPAPAVAELLTAIGPGATKYLTIIKDLGVLEVGSFDQRCAIELATLNNNEFSSGDRKSGAEPYQKRKVDRQIIAICKVNNVSELYTDDAGLAKSARLCGIKPVRTAELEIPQSALQTEMSLDNPSADNAGT